MSYEDSPAELRKADLKAKRAITRVNNLREQHERERKLVEETAGSTRKSKQSAQKIWRDAMGTGHSASSSTRKRTVSQGQERHSEENPSKVQKTSNTSLKTLGVQPAADLATTASEDSDDVAPTKSLGKSTQASGKKAASRSLKSHSKPKNADVGEDSTGESSEESGNGCEKSQASSDEDDELASGRLNPQQSAEQFAAEAVTSVQNSKGAKALFDSDDDAVMGRPARIRASSTSSGGRTVPASSETDAYGAAASDKMDEDEDKATDEVKKVQISNHIQNDSENSDDIVVPTSSKKIKLKKLRKAGVKRTEAFKTEQPTIAKEASISRASKNRGTNGKDTASKSWPAHARIIPNPSGNGDMRLQEQDPLISRLIRDGMEVVTKHALFTHAWPDVDSGAAFRSDILQRVTKSRRASDPNVVDVIERVKVDAEFAKELSVAMVSRLPILRSPIKMSASTEIAGFMLGKGSRCVERVKALKEKDLYIFPGDWAPGNLWKPESHRPFLNDALIDILKTSFFATSTAVGFKFQNSYVSTVDGRTEPELPIAMVALAATGMYAALSDWSGGTQVVNSNGRVGAKFEGNLFVGTYRRLVGVLEALQKQSPIGFHSILSELYTKVIGDAVAEANQPSGALDVMDVSRYQ
ncbi:hypothetical protein M413DRAFT_32927 [Hebeloma cylindrosporum]|uniref:DUF6532 domain-containing protein n=1 Tax=Hebeloma cylindrosporum TaxID=76867 RepID=A0A0C3BS60_HEBCY|nr:hypothetical protein M413DRAFT_32927 [Hebeloma cylindrosporum h7]